MAHWMRFDHKGSIGFGTISDGAITVHAGDMFEFPMATDVLLALDDVVDRCQFLICFILVVQCPCAVSVGLALVPVFMG